MREERYRYKLKMSSPTVSVIVAARNAERFLAQALNSILSQTYQPHEIIVVDGQSTDSTAEIARSCPRVRHVCQNGEGFADAWNIGIEEAEGELIAILDSDDLWVAEKLRLQAGYLGLHEDIQYTVGKVKFFLEAGCALPRGFKRELLEGEHVGHMPSNLVARSSLFREIGAFETGWSIASDLEWFARARNRRVPMDIIPEVLLHRRVHDSNLSYCASGSPVFGKEMLKVLKQSIDFQRQQGQR